ncbi:hypothetical protein CIW49_27895 [Mycolicibacterium sp. P1-18]|nr:hypothetical protein CIW49_27895 [Mycolicibacterium sp. P1-18]
MNRAEAPTTFDYLVVGGGTAGCVLAARLSEDPARRVLLLEAGSADGGAPTADPRAWPGLWGTAVDWADQTVPQIHSGGAVHGFPRGKVLGGSSSINGMIHLRAHHSSYDHWDALGARGWNYRSLLPFLQRSEQVAGGDTHVRGQHGPMVIAGTGEPDPLSSAWFAAAVEAGHPVNPDGNGMVTDGVSWTEMNVVGGRRQSAADAYLRPCLDRPNLVVVTDARVQRLLFDGRRCRGADYTTAAGDHRVQVEREVVVCAGTVGSAQLLMLSGIGPANHLRHNDVDLLVDAPGVGQDLQDHPLCWLPYAAARPLPSTNAVPHVLLHSADVDGDPDLQIGFTPMLVSPRWTFQDAAGYCVTFSLMTPTSRGSVRLSGPGAGDPLLIDPAYFAEDDDLDRMVTGLRRAHDIAEAEALTPWRGAPLVPVDVSDDDACRAYVRASAVSYFHPIGTCRMGTDRRAVVDPHLRVVGVDGLRVADASVMPAIVSANTNATVLAIAERAAALITSSANRATPYARAFSTVNGSQ